ncbi:MAG TPA: hypothetical protein VFU32_05565 [Ktedonobacterales bacterium]|nr:hypothetical protein [Ktedonobacterales bacterium]
MKKGEKPPEMEAFERAFGRGAQGMPNAGVGRDTNASWQQPNPSTPRRQPTPPGGINRQSTPPAGMRPPGASSSFPTRVAGPSSLSRPLGTAPSLRSPAASHTPGRVASAAWDRDSELEEEEDDFADEEEAGGPAPRGRRAAPVVRDRFSTALVRLVLALAALVAAYSLQSHSQKNYAYTAQQSFSAPGTAVGISALSYDAGWPLTYANVELQNPPLSNLSPTPTLHDIQPAKLLVDVLLLAVPLWIVLEAVWLFWSIVLSRFGPRKPLRRFIAVGFTGLPATLWVLGGLAVGGYLSATSAPTVAPSTWPKVVWLALAPAIPGFNLASAVSSLLSIPPNLWWQDFGIFLLVMGLPIALLTACLYVFFCLIGRGLHRSGGQRAGK